MCFLIFPFLTTFESLSSLPADRLVTEFPSYLTAARLPRSLPPDPSSFPPYARPFLALCFSSSSFSRCLPPCLRSSSSPPLLPPAAPVDRKPIIGLGGVAETPGRKPRGAGLGGGLGLRTPSSSSSAGAVGGGRRSRGLAGRVRQLEGHTSLSRRLDHLEARVETSRLQREAYKQTNSILTKVLAELRRINGILEEQQEQRFQPSHHIHAGGGQRQQHHDQEPGSPNQGIIIVEAYADQL